jgi:hypothetical protein
VKGPIPSTPPHSPKGGAHANVYKRACVLTKQMNESSLINGQKLLAPGQEVLRSTRSGSPQWEVPRVGTPAPEVQAAGVHRDRESSGAPTQAAS